MKYNTTHRKRGYVKTTKGANYPVNYLFFDTESHLKQINILSDELPLRVGVAIHVSTSKTGVIKSREVHVFHSIDEFFSILNQHINPRIPLNVFAHNMRHDIRVLNLPEELVNRFGHSDYPVMNERLFVWITRYRNATVNYIDTSNFAVSSLAKLGKDLGFPKLEVDFTNVTDEELIIYCKRDVEIIERFVLEYVAFLRDNNLGTFCTTLASQAMRAWRQRFMQHGVYIHTHDGVLNIERLAYTGGRVECFHIGELKDETYYYLDVNSMYPFVMSGKKIPIKLISYSEQPRSFALRNSLNQRYTIAEVLIETDKPAYPFKRDGKLIFPVGVFRTVLHQPELEYAIRHNHIKQVYKLASYEYGDIFSEYVKFFYEVKQHAGETGNLSWRFIAKIFLNSLYGKFGQQGITRTLVGHTEEKTVQRITFYDDVADRFFQEINWFGDLLIEEKGGESTYSFPAIAGAVTAYARMHLWHYIETANPANVFYCDTDSIIVNEAGYNNLSSELSETELGKLKLEKQSNHLIITNAKDYEFGDERKTKGVPKNAVLLDKNAWLYLQFEGFYSWLHRGGKGAPFTHYKIKSRVSNYDKGIIKADGSVIPISLHNEE